MVEVQCFLSALSPVIVYFCCHYNASHTSRIQDCCSEQVRQSQEARMNENGHKTKERKVDWLDSSKSATASLTWCDPVTRLKLSMGPIRGPGPVAYTRAMSEHRCFPKKRLSILIQCILNDITEIYPKMTMSHWKRIINEDTHLLLMWKEKSLYRCIKLTRRWNMKSSYFCRGPDDFGWGPAPVGPTLVTGPKFDGTVGVVNRVPTLNGRDRVKGRFSG